MAHISAVIVMHSGMTIPGKLNDSRPSDIQKYYIQVELEIH